MATILLDYKQGKLDGRETYTTITRAGYESFAPALLGLGLGDISSDAKVMNALAAVFDLEGFTSFCGQSDPHLVIPEYLTSFLDWLFKSIRERFTKAERGDTMFLASSLPFFAKFMGDGVLFLWDTEHAGGMTGIGNIAICLSDIRARYEERFLPKADAAYSKTPRRLRLGIARGQVFSIGNGSDCVGPCINIAARLQKLGSLPFAISRKGFMPEKCFSSEMQKLFTVVKTPLRGVGDDETIIVLKSDLHALPIDQKKLFRSTE